MLWKSSQFKAKYYQSLVTTYSTYRIQGLKTSVAFTPNLDKVYVIPSVISKSPKQMGTEMIKPQESPKNLSIWDFLAEIPQEPAYRRMLIIGSPGVGKTQLLQYLTLSYALDTYREQHPEAPKFIPVLLSVSKITKYVNTKHPLNLSDLISLLIQEQKSSFNLEPPPQWFEQKLVQGKCLVMFDGLDEVTPESTRLRVSQWLDMQMRTYAESTFIITSRPHGYNTQIKEARICLQLQTFNQQQIKQFLDSWYLENEIMRQARREEEVVRRGAKDKATKLIALINNHPGLVAMAVNPLLLIIIANFQENYGSLPKKRLNLYNELCDILLERRSKLKGFNNSIFLEMQFSKNILQILALELMLRKKIKLPVKVVIEIVQNILTAIGENRVTATEFVEYIEKITGLLVRTEDNKYRFLHRSIQEYLASVQVHISKKEQFLLDNIDQFWWGETILLYAARNDTTKLIRAAWDKRTVYTMTLAYNCWEEGKSVHPDLRKRLEKWLDAALESTDLDIARLAAQVQLSRRLQYAVAGD